MSAINDPLSDLIARIKNAAMRKRSKVSTPASKLRQRVLDVLQDEGYIRGYALVETAGEFPVLRDRAEVLRRRARDRRDRPRVQAGRRVYSSIKDLKPIKNGLGISILPRPRA
jgi:small subunit ribosomal protein S8